MTVARRIARRSRGFTLVELVIVLTVIGLMAGLAIPSVGGIIRERQAREPVRELLRMARTVRARAMEEGRPYQIGFDREGFHAARFLNPYGERAGFDQQLADLEEAQRREELIAATRDRLGGLAGAEAEIDPRDERFYEYYPLPEGIGYSLMFWGQTEWQPVDGGRFERWVFQPTGLCSPLRIQMEARGAYFEVEFHPLTGAVRTERSWVE